MTARVLHAPLRAGESRSRPASSPTATKSPRGTDGCPQQLKRRRSLSVRERQPPERRSPAWLREVEAHTTVRPLFRRSDLDAYLEPRR
jgi:hypothetical protein